MTCFCYELRPLGNWLNASVIIIFYSIHQGCVSGVLLVTPETSHLRSMKPEALFDVHCTFQTQLFMAETLDFLVWSPSVDIIFAH